MTQDQIARVQDSFRAVLPIKDKAAALFYDRLFLIDPSTRPLFAHVAMAAQGDKLVSALGFVVGSLRAPGPLLAAVRQLAVRHVAYGARDVHYASVGEALLWTLEAGLGDRWTPDHRTAWAAAFTMLSGAMMEAAHDATVLHVWTSGNRGRDVKSPECRDPGVVVRQLAHGRWLDGPVCWFGRVAEADVGLRCR